MYEVQLPKVLFLALTIAHHFHKKHFINTNDIALLANEFAIELVRQRKDKKDYKYLQDTNFGGLRGNLSTLLTFRRINKKDSAIVSYYGIGRDDRILNALMKGEIILKSDDFTSHTINEKLKNPSDLLMGLNLNKKRTDEKMVYEQKKRTNLKDQSLSHIY